MPRDDDRLIASYRQALRRRGLEQTTIASYSARLHLFSFWLGRGLLTAERDDVERFIDTRKARTGGGPIGTRARYRWLSDLHGLYRWAIMEGLTGSDPTVAVQRPRLRPGLPHPIATDDIATAVELADPTMRAMLLAAQFAGARCIEISRMQAEDVIHGGDPMLILHGKGSKDRVVPLHPALGRALQRMPSTGPLFGIPPWEVSHRINAYLRDLGLSDTAHSLRHWYGTFLYAETKDLIAVQVLMGHESPNTTRIYTQFTPTDAIKDAARRLGGTKSPDDLA